MKTLCFIIIIYLATINLIGFSLMGIDKKRAIRGAWRISESSLFLTAVLGGSIGCIIGMQLFRHKTKHYYFYAVNILGLAWQVAVAYLLYAKGF